MASVGLVGWVDAAEAWRLPSRAGERSSAPGPSREAFHPPTGAPVLDPFRPPPQPWLPGNRGIEYATAPGDPVTAIGRGRVVFAGPVAGRLVVSIDHPGGLRSTYTALGGLAVARGDAVAGGTVVGAAGGPFHLGVRRGDRYLDPALLWGTPVGGGRVFLVPTDSRSSPPAVRRGRGGRGTTPPPWAGGQVIATLVNRPITR